MMIVCFSYMEIVAKCPYLHHKHYTIFGDFRQCQRFFLPQGFFVRIDKALGAVYTNNN